MENNPTLLPGHTHQPDGIHCAECGRFVGAMSRCPHCGAQVRKGMTLRGFRWAALLLATVGLGLLYAMSIYKEIPRIDIGEINQTMNFAFVRIAGHVVGDARVFREDAIVTGVRFSVNDGTGILSIRAYGAKAKALDDAGKVPLAGDLVELSGSLNVSAQDRVMYLQSPDHLAIERPPLESAAIDEITEELIGRRIQTEGRILRITDPGNNPRRPWTLSVGIEQGRRDVVIWQSVYSHWPARDIVKPGDYLTLRAEVSEYRGRIQLTVNRVDDLEHRVGPSLETGEPMTAATTDDRPVASAHPGVVTPQTGEVSISSIQRSMRGSTAAIRGRIKGVRTIRGGTVLTLADESGEIEAVLWNRRVSGPVLDRLTEGASVRLRGKVDEYRERLQLVPQHADDVYVEDIDS